MCGLNRESIGRMGRTGLRPGKPFDPVNADSADSKLERTKDGQPL